MRSELATLLQSLQSVHLTETEHVQIRQQILASSAQTGAAGLTPEDRLQIRSELEQFTQQYAPESYSSFASYLHTSPAFGFTQDANLFRHLEPFCV